MYVLFGTKWCRIFSGPLWSHISVEQASTCTSVSNSTTNPIKVESILVHYALNYIIETLYIVVVFTAKTFNRISDDNKKQVST